ncbi:5-formyltetrahydrofolate cyclo-ligase, partial [Amylibacter sp.]|nr:5-formyltetrahydrofolate cyclo-ligase [Amylibacter sp.]
GGGFYDRSFEEITKLKEITAVGFAYSSQEVLAVPSEPTDYKLDHALKFLSLQVEDLFQSVLACTLQ